MARILYRDSGDENGDLVVVCGFRLFINGVDVSDHVMGSISWSFQERGGENSLSFTLDNNNSKFELRPGNLGLSEPAASDDRSFADTESFATKSPWKIVRMKPTGSPGFVESSEGENRGLVTFSEAAKHKMYADKVDKRVRIDSETGVNYNMKTFVDKTTGAVSESKTSDAEISLYDGLLHSRACIINVMDQVRLYVLDPNTDPVLETDSLWIPAFTGFVMSAPPEHDFSTGASSISITCSDIRTLLKRKRVLLNSATADQMTPTIGINSGLFRDVALQNTTTTNALADQSLTFESLVALALMGVRIADESRNLKDYCLAPRRESSTSWESDRKAHQPQGQNDNGFGSLWFGYYYEYGPQFTTNSEKIGDAAFNSYRSQFLNDWNRLTVFGASHDHLSFYEMMEQGSGTKPGGEYSALGALVHFLVPAGGTKVTSLLDRTFIDDMGVQREYMSVGEIIEQVCERLDYQYMVTGSGDIVFEFPMYDFLPHDMGEEFRNVCSVSDSVKNDSINDEANSNPITALKVTGGYNDQMNSVQLDDRVRDNSKYSAYLVHDLLSYRYGLSMEEYQVPFLASGASTQMDDNKYNKILVLFGCIEFLKRLTEMSAMTIDGCYNPFLRPNRPYYYAYGRRLAITTNVQNTLALFQNADTQVDTKYVRRIHDITAEVVAFSGTIGLPFKYSDASTLDVFYETSTAAQYEAFLTQMGNAGINILVPTEPQTATDGQARGGTNFSSLTKKSPDKRVCSWTPSDVAAFNKLCNDQGAKPKDVLMVMAQESTLNIGLTNKKKDGTGTYALGLNQMLPVSVIDTLNSSSELRSKYPGSSQLLNSKFTKRSRKGKLYVPDHLKPEFERTYYDVFGTPEAQLDMYNAYLSMNKKNLGSGYKYDSVDKLAAAQLKPSSLKALGQGQDVELSESEKKANPGVTSMKQYAGLIRKNYERKVEGWLGSMGSCAEQVAGSDVPPTTPSQGVSNAAVLGGVGNKYTGNVLAAYNTGGF